MNPVYGRSYTVDDEDAVVEAKEIVEEENERWRKSEKR